LTDAMDEFETRRRPDVILAEPVGSCTDLIGPTSFGDDQLGRWSSVPASLSGTSPAALNAGPASRKESNGRNRGA